MKEHLDGSYPTLKFRNNQARDNGQTNAHVNDMWPFGNYHIGRERLFIILQGSESPRVIMATSAPFSFLSVRQLFTLNKRNDGFESTWRKTSDDSEAFGH